MRVCEAVFLLLLLHQSFKQIPAGLSFLNEVEEVDLSRLWEQLPLWPTEQCRWTFHAILSTRKVLGWGGGCSKARQSIEKWNQIRRAEEEMERKRRRTEVVDWVPPEILLFKLFCVSLLSSSPLPSSLQTSEVDYNRDPGSHLWLKPGTYGAESVFERPVQCGGIPPSGPQVVVRFIFLSIVSCWDIKGLLFVHQQGYCRLLAGPGWGSSAFPLNLCSICTCSLSH